MKGRFKNRRKEIFIIFLFLIILVFFFSGFSMGKEFSRKDINGITEIAKPILQVENGSSLEINNSNREGIYEFKVKNYNEQGEKTQVDLEYYIEILSDLENSGIELKLFRNDQEISINENKTENKVVSSNLNVEGNLTIGATKDINIKASNLNSNQDITLKSGNDINILNDYDTVSKENIRKDITVSAGANIGNSYVDTVNATKDFYNATKAVSDAKENLNKIKDAQNNGKASNEAVKDAEYNLSLALINLANAEIGLASSVSGGATAAASSFGTGMYASVSSNNNINKHTENYTSMQSVASNISGENIHNSSDNDLNQIGSNITANDTVSYNVLNKLKVLAGENTYSSSSSDEHIVAGASYGNNAVQLNAGYDKSTNRAHGTNYTSSNTNANNILIATGSDAEFSGANINANETLIASIGGNLSLESKQDTDYAKGKSFGFNTSGGIGVEGDAKGKNSSGFGVNSTSSYHDSAWVNDMTELTGKNVDINVAGKTSLTGAMIDGSESLHLATNKLEYKDLQDFDRSNDKGYGVNTGVGISTNKGETNLHPNGETSLTLKDTGNDKEQITHATIGEGVIEVAQDSDLIGLNRNTTKAQEITKNMTTGALDATASIDNRIFMEKGRADIVEQHEKLGENLSQIGDGLRNNIITKTIENTIKGDKSLSENFYDYLEQDRQMTELKENRKDLMLALNGMTNFDSEEAKNILQQIADLTAGENGFSGKLQLANVEGNVVGFSYQSNDGEIKNITINLANVDLTKPNDLMNVIYHETTNFEEHNRKEQNAINRGKTGAGIFSLKNFGNENTNGMSKTEWMKENNLTIGSTGSLSLLSDYNSSQAGNGEGNPQVATATGCSLGPIGCVAGAGIDWIVAGTVATSVATAGLMLYNSSNDNSSGQEPENMNNNDNNGGDKDPNYCKNNPDKCNNLDKLKELIKNYLGKDARQQNTPKGNKQFISHDNDKVVRFDLNNESKPHINIELRSEGINEHIFFDK